MQLSKCQCKKSLSSQPTNPCPLCNSDFCSKICLSIHSKQNHTRQSTYRSIFQTKGELLPPQSEQKLNQGYFSFANFTICQDKHTQQLHKIGSGAFGDVYLAENLIDKKLYAMKHVKKSKVIEAGASLETIYQEVNIQSRIIHENIARLYSYFEDNDNVYMIMEYLPKGTLFSYIKNNAWSEDEAFKLFIQIVNGVCFLHENNFIHRDIKPENILLGENGNIKLCDFGWCVATRGEERTTFCGTFEYIAPEIINDKGYSKEIDVWSIGVWWYELTHGYSPFRAKSKVQEEFQEICMNIVKLDYNIDKKLSRECVDWIDKILITDSSKRLKIKEIFAHPFVRKYEMERKKDKIQNYMKDNNCEQWSNNNNSKDDVMNKKRI